MFYGCVPSSIRRALVRCDEMRLVDTGSLYQKVPLRCFARLTRISLHGTTISIKHFLQMVRITRQLRVLDIGSCGNNFISESMIFEAKESLHYMTNINVSYNTHVSVLSIACLCSFHSIQEMHAEGITLGVKETLFWPRPFHDWLVEKLIYKQKLQEAVITSLMFWTPLLTKNCLKSFFENENAVR